MRRMIVNGSEKETERLREFSRKHYGVIYKATHTSTGRVYIGLTTKLVTIRISQHITDSQVPYRRNSYFLNSLKKYGPESFTWDIIDIADNDTQLGMKEKYWIQFYESTNRDKGFNRTLGGEHTVFTVEARENMRQAQINKKPLSPEAQAVSTRKRLEKMRKYYETHDGWSKGKPCPEHVKRALSEFNKGKKLSEEHKLKISDAHRGKKRTEEHKLKTGKASSQRWRGYSPEKKQELLSRLHSTGPWNKGVPCEDATKEKISRANKNRISGMKYLTREDLLKKMAPVTLQELLEHPKSGKSLKGLSDSHKIPIRTLLLALRVFSTTSDGIPIPKDELVSLMKKPMSYRSIGKVYGIDKLKVCEYFLRYGIDPNELACHIPGSKVEDP